MPEQLYAMLSKLRRVLAKSRAFAGSAAARAGRPGGGPDGGRGRLLFSFHGGDRAWPGIGQRLYQEEESFREAVGRLSPGVERSLGFSLSDFFAGREVSAETSPEDRERRQIVILSTTGIALCELWRAYGVEPDAVIGDCGGEIGAGYAAGALTLEEAAEVACSVARLVTQTNLKGHFVWLGVDFYTARRLALRSASKLQVVLDLSPASSLAYCAAAEFEGVARLLDESGVTRRAAGASWAYHTPDSNALERMAGRLYRPGPRPLVRPFYSAAAGGVLPPGTVLTADHWYKAATEPVMFGHATCAALSDGFDVILNLCGSALLKSASEDSARAFHKRPLIMDTVRRGEPELTTWKEALEALRESGVKKVGARRAGLRPAPDSNGAGAAVSVADSINLLSPEVLRDPYPFYAALRRSGPIHFLKRHGFWLVLDYDDVVRALKHPEVFSSVKPAVRFDPVLTESDPPAHTRGRRILSPHFSAQSAQALEAYVRDCAAGLLREAGRPAEFDLVGGFAEPLTELTITRLLGLSEEQTASLRGRLAPHRRSADGLLFATLEEWMREYVERLSAHPDESLGGRLLKGEGEAALAPEEVVTLLKLLWAAGTHTTERLIATSALMLLRHAPVRDEVQADSGLLPAFVEEVLRLDTPELMAWRATRAEVEVSGVKIAAGAEVRLSLAAANHDPAHFSEPEKLSLGRSPNNHLSFAAGPHYCLGAGLTRMEARVALETLLAEWPDFHAARPLHTISYFAEYHSRTLNELFVGAG